MAENTHPGGNGAVPIGVPAGQAVDAPKSKSRKSRVQVRHLSRNIRQLIVQNFAATGCSEEVAREFHVPARTVTDAVLLEFIRKPIDSERRLNFGNKRQA